MAENYEHLEKVKIDWIDWSGKLQEGILEVAGCEYDIGVSLVLTRPFQRFKKGKEMACLHGELSPYKQKYEDVNPDYRDNYDHAFNNAIKVIKEGVYEYGSFNRWLGHSFSQFGGGGISCAFT